MDYWSVGFEGVNLCPSQPSLTFTKTGQDVPPFRAVMHGILRRAWGSLFKPTTICPVVFGTAPKYDVIIVAAPQGKVACMTDLACACLVTDVQAMGAVRARGLNWVAVLKRDPHAPSLAEQSGMYRPSGR